MATGGATGFVLHIDDELINKLNTADQKIQDLAKHSEESRDRIVNAFKAMGDNGVQYFIDKLTEAQNQLKSLKDSNIDIKVNGLDNIGNSVSKSADDVNKLMTSMDEMTSKLKKVGTTDGIIPNIGQLKNAIDEINTKLNEPKSALTAEQQQTLVDTRELFKKVVSIQQKSTEQRKEDTKKLYAEARKMRQANLQEIVADYERQDKLRQDDLKKQQQADSKIRESQIKEAQKKVSIDMSSSSKETEELQKQFELQKEISKAKMESYSKGVDDRKKELAAQEETRKKNLSYLNELYKEEQKEAEKAEKEKTKIEEREAKERIRRRQQIQKQIEAMQKQDLQKEKEIQKEREAVWKQGFAEYDKQVAAKKKQAEDYNKTFAGAIRYSQSAENFKEEKKAIEYLEAARDRLKKSDIAYQAKLDAINIAIQKHRQSLQQQGLTEQQVAELAKQAADKKEQAAQRAQKAVERETAAYQRRKQLVIDKWYSNTPQKALDFSANTKSINEQIKAIQYLKTARDNLSKRNMTENEYLKQITAINNEIKRQQGEVDKLRAKQEGLANSHRNLMDISGQLQRRLALVFSVSQITGYMKQLVEVRGEFELQQKSLQVLLQSKDQADKLWQQTVQLAVQSPFRVSELVSYTRQLAA